MPNPCTLEYQAGEEFSVGEQTIVPFVKTWQWQSPGGRRLIVWNRPASLLVRSKTGDEQIIHIPDMTRRVVLSLMGLCLGAALVVWVISVINRTQK